MTKRRNGQSKKKQMPPSTPISAPVTQSVITRHIPKAPRITVRNEITAIPNVESAFTVRTDTTPSRIVVYPTQTSWLANVARGYSRFRYKKLRVVYIPYCSTSTNGNLTMAFGYDFNDQTPPNTDQLTSYYNSTSTALWGGSEGGSLLMTKNIDQVAPKAVYMDLDTRNRSLGWCNFATQAQFNAAPPSAQSLLAPAYVQLLIEGGPTPTPAAVLGKIFFNYVVEFADPINPALQ